VLTAGLVAVDVNGVMPTVRVYDADHNPQAIEVLLNGNGTYTIQAVGLQPGRDYFLKVEPDGEAGNYRLIADFGNRPAALVTFASRTVGPLHPQDNYALYVAVTQLFQLALTAGTPGVSQRGEVRMELRDGQDRVLSSLTARAGNTVSGTSILLTPGEYRVSFRVEVPCGPLPTLSYRLRGVNLSDPIGPCPDDPSMRPEYTSEDPGMYSYPDSTTSQDPYHYSYEEGSSPAPGGGSPDRGGWEVPNQLAPNRSSEPVPASGSGLSSSAGAVAESWTSPGLERRLTLSPRRKAPLTIWTVQDELFVEGST
jgi:hypothetical protein